MLVNKVPVLICRRLYKLHSKAGNLHFQVLSRNVEKLIESNFRNTFSRLQIRFSREKKKMHKTESLNIFSYAFSWVYSGVFRKDDENVPMLCSRMQCWQNQKGNFNKSERKCNNEINDANFSDIFCCYYDQRNKRLHNNQTGNTFRNFYARDIENIYQKRS